LRIIAKRTLRQYWEIYPETEQHLKTWYQTVATADWNTPNDVKSTYRNASIVGDGMVVFNIRGNHHRLIVKIHYNRKIVFVRFLGTHKDYDDLDLSKL